MHVLAPRGGLRAGGVNRGPLHAAAEVVPQGVRVEIAEIGGVSPHKGDLEPQGWPTPVTALRDRAYDAAAILFARPGYGDGLCDVSKDTFDWLSRPEDAAGSRAVTGRKRNRNPFQDEPGGSFGASAGTGCMGGTLRAPLAVRRSLRLNAALTPPRPEVFVGGTRTKFGPDGMPTHARTREYLARGMGAFAAWMRRLDPAAERPHRPATPPEAGSPARQP